MRLPIGFEIGESAELERELPIEPSSLRINELFHALMRDESFGNWRLRARIVPKYKPPFADAETKSRCVVRVGSSFLRHSHGPRQGHFWDVYGDDYLTPELAFLALLQADPPPWLWVNSEEPSP